MSNNCIFIPDINVGERIIQYLKEIGSSQAHLARKMNMLAPNVARILKRDSMGTKWLYAISSALEYNFFAELCNDPKHTKEGYMLIQPNIGEKISARLKAVKMTQTEFASHLGIARTDVSRIIKRSSFDSDRLRTISRLLNHNFFGEYYTTPTNEEGNLPTERMGVLGRYEELVLINDSLKKENVMLKAELYELHQRLSVSGIV